MLCSGADHEKRVAPASAGISKGEILAIEPVVIKVDVALHT
jgi:hypothetical protein